jgi:hypothetical protein
LGKNSFGARLRNCAPLCVPAILRDLLVTVELSPQLLMFAFAPDFRTGSKFLAVNNPDW